MSDALYAINEKTYQWSVRLFSMVRRLLSVNIRFHHYADQIEQGDIFLFNHFARFETFIPQYLIHKETGSYCRSVAASEFFKQDDALANYLRSVGAVPNNHPQLLPFLATEILKGRKVIIFPEGGMVKDRRVVDAPGKYSIYSRTARERRKHHRGAAVLALALDAYKKRAAYAAKCDDQAWLVRQVEELGLSSVEALLKAVAKPTRIVPANITFYPIRVGDNLLHKGMEVFGSGLTRRASEELLIEGNILLKNTDMDIRLSDPLEVSKYWRWLDTALTHNASKKLNGLKDFFNLPETAGLIGRGLARRIKRKSEVLRDVYMHEMYRDVTINLSHLASVCVFRLIESGLTKIKAVDFHRILYCTLKYLQTEKQIHLHHGLTTPSEYNQLWDGRSVGLEQFFNTASRSELIELHQDTYHFTEKLCEQHEFDMVRLENLVEVYANEVAPISAVKICVTRAINALQKTSPIALAKLRFDDELIAYKLDKQQFSGGEYDEINAQQTATLDGNSYLFVPKAPRRLGVVLVHGFLASPAELKQFGQRLADQGYPVIGVRLKGHGTSPWDLRERNWEDWLASVQRGYQILSAYCESVCMIGFSTGGTLVLRHAASQPENLAGLVAVSVPVKFKNKKMMLVPLVHGANKLLRSVSSSDGVFPFQVNNSEHPEVNYRHIPMHGLFELRQLVADTEEHLAHIKVPCLIVQGDNDPVVDPESAAIIHEKLPITDKKLLIVESNKHGILNENIGATQERILDYVQQLEQSLVLKSDANAT